MRQTVLSEKQLFRSSK